jgi:hypothetical protein
MTGIRKRERGRGREREKEGIRKKLFYFPPRKWLIKQCQRKDQYFSQVSIPFIFSTEG